METRLNISFTAILVACAIIVGLVILPLKCGDTAKRHVPLWAYSMMENSRYTPSNAVSGPNLEYLPPELGQHVSSMLSGVGTWVPSHDYTPSDMLIVEAVDVTLDDGSNWIKVIIDGDVVKFEKVESFNRPEKINRRWNLSVELTNCGLSRTGITITYNFWKVGDVAIGAGIGGSTNADWIAPVIEVSTPIWSGVSIRAGAGYRFFCEDGLHLSGGIGIEL